MIGLLLMLSMFSSIDVSPTGVTERPQRFEYDAVADKNQRKSPRVSFADEDTILPVGKRDKLTANARDLNRNFSVAAWAIRQHMNYVAAFHYHARNKDKGLNRDMEFLLERSARAPAFDAAGRHRLSRFLRLTEIRRILDGDCGVLRIADGSAQGIEGDRIRNPRGAFAGRWVNGVKLNPSGRAMAYAIHTRDKGRLQYEKTVSGGNLFLHGAYDRFDQVRGVSPIAAALNQFRDVYENFSYALAKAKVEQLFALAFFRKADESAGQVYEAPVVEDDEDSDAEEEQVNETKKYEVDFGRGPVLLDLEPGDDAKFLESQHPSSQFQDFTQLVTMVALKALDIPYSFYDESHTNFFGSRGAWLHYERSCMEKREDLQDLLRWWTLWRTQLWILDGELKLPRGMTIGDLYWEWVPVGMPWWDAAKEITGDLKAIEAGLDNPYRITKERGRGDFEDNIDEIATAVEYARSKGFLLSFDRRGQEEMKAAAAKAAQPPAPEKQPETEEPSDGGEGDAASD